MDSLFSFPVGLFHPPQYAGCSENIYRLNGSGGVDSGVQPNLHRETEAPKTSQVMVSTTFPPPLFGCVFGATKWHPLFQHAVKNDQHEMSHRDNRAFLATPWCESLKTGSKNRVTLTGCRPCTLHQGRTEIRVAVGGLWSFLNACTFPITWAQARPTRHLLNGRKGVQVWPGLCQDRGGRTLAYSGNGL